MHPEAVFVRAGCVAGALDGALGAIEVLSFRLDSRSECFFFESSTILHHAKVRNWTYYEDSTLLNPL